MDTQRRQGCCTHFDNCIIVLFLDRNAKHSCLTVASLRLAVSALAESILPQSLCNLPHDACCAGRLAVDVGPRVFRLFVEPFLACLLFPEAKSIGEIPAWFGRLEDLASVRVARNY